MAFFSCVCVIIASGCASANNPSPGAPASEPAIASPAQTQGGDSAPSDTPEAAVYHKITADQAKAMMDDGDAYILVDVRTQEEYDAQRIGDAILIPYDQMKDRAATDLPDKNARILVYCRSGVRASAAAHTLVDLGYTNVYDMGGIIDWPYDTVSG